MAAPKCKPPTTEQFERASAFTRTFKSNEEWIEYVNKIHNEEKDKIQKQRDKEDKQLAIFTACIYSVAILIALYVEFFE